MAFTAELPMKENLYQKCSSETSWTEKTQMLINHPKHLHLGLSLTADISENVVTVKMYDNYAVNSLLLHITISKLWDIEDQLFRIWIEVNGVIHDHMPTLI